MNNNLDKKELEALAWVWAQPRIDRMEIKPQECLVHYNKMIMEYTAEFYNFDDNTKFDSLFITVPMMKQLIEGKNPKKVKNEFIKPIREENFSIIIDGVVQKYKGTLEQAMKDCDWEAYNTIEDYIRENYIPITTVIS